MVEVCVNPFGVFREECAKAVLNTVGEIYPEVEVFKVPLEVPPYPKFGDLSSLICFELSKSLSVNFVDLAVKIAESIRVDDYPLISRVEAVNGYVNFFVDVPKFAELTVESIRKLDSEYGFVKIDKPLRVIVEHTSANPIHPLHIGQARNPILGDALARILEARGHNVRRHFYVNDAGRQVAIIAYGYDLLGRPKPEGKPDAYMGIIYAVTNCLIEIKRLKKEIENAKACDDMERFRKAQRELDDWVSVAAELREKHREVFDKLLDEIEKETDSYSKISELVRGYEEGDEEVKRLFRSVCDACIEGFKQTLGRVGIKFDSWDWESEFLWDGTVSNVLERLMKTPFVRKVEGALVFDAGMVVDILGLREELNLSKDYEVPSLTLARADGTTLYTTRDIAYTLWKFKFADKVINVIGAEQSLAQLQLKLALYALGYKDMAKNLIHYAYNLVRLPGYRMSSRRGRYITFDSVLDEAVRRAREEIPKHSPNLPEDMIDEVAVKVGVGAVKYAMIEVDPAKPVIFTWEQILNFERNSAPYIQYAHARACSIMRKAGYTPTKPDYTVMGEIEKELIITLSRFPEIFVKAAEDLKPSLIADYANTLADKFNSFYAKAPVLKAKPEKLKDARLALVDATRIVIRNALNLIGIDAPERM